MTAATMTAWVRAVLLSVLLGMGALGAHAADNDAAAQVAREATQPSNNAPVWRAVNEPTEHTSTIKSPEAGVLIQAGGHEWRLFRNGVITVYGGWLQESRYQPDERPSFEVCHNNPKEHPES